MLRQVAGHSLCSMVEDQPSDVGERGGGLCAVELQLLGCAAAGHASRQHSSNPVC
jgi:hypothetical protein